MRFDGATYGEADEARLASQFDRVKDLMLDGVPRTIYAIQAIVGGSEAAISARLRDLRKPRFGSYRVERRRERNGVHVYQVLPPLPVRDQARLF